MEANDAIVDAGDLATLAESGKFADWVASCPVVMATVVPKEGGTEFGIGHPVPAEEENESSPDPPRRAGQLGTLGVLTAGQPAARSCRLRNRTSRP